MKPESTIDRWMSPAAHSVSRDTSVATAHDVMRRYGIRHLPVVDGADLVGVISERDVVSVSRFIDPFRTRVGYVLTEAPYVTSPGASLAEVASDMVARKHACAVVVDGGRVVGIFTAIDGLRALAEDRIAASASRLDATG